MTVESLYQVGYQCPNWKFLLHSGEYNIGVLHKLNPLKAVILYHSQACKQQIQQLLSHNDITGQFVEYASKVLLWLNAKFTKTTRSEF